MLFVRPTQTSWFLSVWFYRRCFNFDTYDHALGVSANDVRIFLGFEFAEGVSSLKSKTRIVAEQIHETDTQFLSVIVNIVLKGDRFIGRDRNK